MFLLQASISALRIFLQQRKDLLLSGITGANRAIGARETLGGRFSWTSMERRAAALLAMKKP
jgi:hypothetical protein